MSEPTLRTTTPAQTAVIDTDRLSAMAPALASAFARATPWPHVAIDDFVTAEVASALGDAFPDESSPAWHVYGDRMQTGKRQCSDIEAMPEPVARFVNELHTPRVLRVLESITGIRGLLADPYLNGGGMHMTSGGGHLLPHTDFHWYGSVGLYRRLNLILYLGDCWSDDWGGEFEQWRHRRVQRRIAPVPGRAVLFRTDNRSVHGVRAIAAGAPPRKSVAVFYYTARDATTFAGDQETVWRVRRDGARGLMFDGLSLVARGFSRLAHAVSPYREGG